MCRSGEQSAGEEGSHSEFLRIWYEEGDTVVRVASELKLSRSYVVHDIQPTARALVAKRFLELASRVEAPISRA